MVPGFLELIGSDRPSGRYRGRRARPDGGGGMSALTVPSLEHAAPARLPELHPLSFSLPARARGAVARPSTAA